MKRIFAALIFALLACSAASAQGCGPSNPNCVGIPDRPAGDSTSSAANTKFVTSAISGGSSSIPASSLKYTNPSSGGVQITQQIYNQERVSIIDFGAIADSSTAYSSTNAATNATALTNALATGKCVFIPFNVNGYSFSGSITVNSGQCIVGEAQVLVKSQNATSFLNIVGFGFPVVQISNLHIDMTGGSGTAIRLDTSASTVFGVRLSMLYITNSVEAIGDNSVTNSVVDLGIYNVRTAFTLGTQIHIRKSQGFIYLQQVQVDNTSNAGAVTWNSIQFDAFSGIEFNAVDVTGPVGTTFQTGVWGIQLTGTGGGAAVWMKRVNVDTTTGNGILIQNLTYGWLSNLDVNHNLGNQVFISTSNNVEIVNSFAGGALGRTGAAASSVGFEFSSSTNVHVSNTSTETNTGSGFHILNSTDNVFSNIRSTGNTVDGIVEIGTSDRNLISGGVFNTNGTADVVLLGANSRAIHYESSGAYVPLTVNAGGTGASTASGARTNLGLGTAATQNTGTSGANLPFLNGNNTWSGTNAFNASFATNAATPPNLTTTGIAGGAPQTSGSTDANQFLISGNGNVQWRFGFYGDGTMWSQPSLQSNYATNFGTRFNPNGGNIGIGLTPALAAPSVAPTSTLTLGGPIATSTPLTKTTNYSQLATDSSLIFNGAGSITLTMLSAASFPGQWLTVKTIAAQTVVSASSNVVPRAGGAAGTAILAAAAGTWADLQSDGTNWIIMRGN